MDTDFVCPNKDFGNGRGSWEAYRLMCFIRTGQRALIPQNFAEGGSEKEVLICTTLLASIAPIPLLL